MNVSLASIMRALRQLGFSSIVDLNLSFSKLHPIVFRALPRPELSRTSRCTPSEPRPRDPNPFPRTGLRTQPWQPPLHGSASRRNSRTAKSTKSGPARPSFLSLKNLHLSPATRASAGPNVDVDAPLAEADEAGAAAASRAARDPPRAELGRRDSLKRREALLKGKAGTRRRQRWENGALPPPRLGHPSNPFSFRLGGILT